jgi:3D (Asp-Asp-Asp) domain-containing protein
MKGTRLIARGPIRVSHALAVTILTAGLVAAGFVTHPSSALASGNSDAIGRTAAGHTIDFRSNGTTTQHVTQAATVGDFLRERNVTVAAQDYVDPATDVPLSDGLVVTYRAGVPVTIQTAHTRVATISSAQDVGALLEERHMPVGPDDVVRPALSAPVPANGVVRIERVLVWTRNEKRAIASKIVHRLDFSMKPGTSRTISKGAPGTRSVMVRFTQHDGGEINASVIASHVTRTPRTRVVADGAGEYQAFERFAAHGIERTAYIAQSALEMVATAYTANCSGCSGMTAIGRRAGHGIVAVDPRVIPLGTRLFIPGYGAAVAGDTGGAIHGNRIDLGFNSQRDALQFGRRQVTVYRLK